MKKLTLMSVLAVLYLLVVAQSPLRPLTINEAVPDVVLTNIANLNNKSANLSQFKDKLVILDFMNTACVSCIEGLPKLNQLQSEFERDLQIILVTPEDQSRINGFHANNIYGKQNKLTFMGEDTVLSALFPHQYIPHIVWINKGKVAAITYPEYVTKENIKRVAAGESPNWPVKREITSFDQNLPLFSINTVNIPEVSQPRQAYYSVLSTHLSGIPKTYLKNEDSLQNISTIRFLGYNIIHMYLLAMGKPVSYPIGHIVLQVRDTNRFVFDAKKSFRQQWIADNTYAYEAVLPFTGTRLDEKLKFDLNSYFSLSAELTQKNIPCYVLEKLSPAVPISVKEQKVDRRNQITIGALIKKLSNWQYGHSAADESGLPENYKIHLSPESYTDISKMKEELAANGLTLTVQTRNTEVLWIKEIF